ncbi:MAG TPA: CDP-alcohol phosphatidyltransferase family protein [Gemmatimonadaceae bacterium]|nr:CDP-alcohol phosphatidyltransferase family protein [Gemmatimonadaceae bacterium]
MNLPNAITVGRIAAAPFIGWLPFASTWSLRLVAFLLFVIVAVSDYYDGMLARSRNLITDLGKQLDPLADKLFLVATFVPMYSLMRTPSAVASNESFRFVTPLGIVGLPLWVVLVVLGREILMTVLRQRAASRGVVIAAIGPAKWKTALQLVWAGSAYFWFWIATAAAAGGWSSSAWHAFENFNGTVGVVTMGGAVILTMYSLALYLRRYGAVLRASAGATSAR